VLAQQTARLNRVRAARDDGVVQAALAALREAARADDGSRTPPPGSPAPLPTSAGGNLLALALDAARADATVGEISAALEEAWGRHQPSVSLQTGVYLAEYNAVAAGQSSGCAPDAAADDDGEIGATRAAAAAFGARFGRRPRMLVAKMGQDGHDRGARVIASAFADLGFDVDVGPLFSTPAEVARQAIDADVHVVGVSSQAAGHRALMPELIKALAAEDAADTMVVCGGVIPEVDHAPLKAAGVAAIFGPGTRIPLAARDVIDELTRRLEGKAAKQQ
jgi:methylmalonyl-CoA mutase